MIPSTDNLVHSAPEPGSANPGSRPLPVHRSVGSSNGSALKRDLDSSNYRTGQAMPSFTNLLTQSGIGAVQPGETVEVHVGPGHKGPHVTEVLSIDSSTAATPARRRPEFQTTTSSRPSSNALVEETGTVKWFNSEKGYGFITRSSGGDDVFVHIAALERSGLTGLSEGDRVIIDVAEGRKGLEAARVRLI